MKTIVDYCTMCYEVWTNEAEKLANKIFPALDNMLTLRALGCKDIKPVSVPKYKFTPMDMAALAHNIYSKGGEI